jgi:hypothetical protein
MKIIGNVFRLLAHFILKQNLFMVCLHRELCPLGICYFVHKKVIRTDMLDAT